MRNSDAALTDELLKTLNNLQLDNNYFLNGFIDSLSEFNSYLSEKLVLPPNIKERERIISLIPNVATIRKILITLRKPEIKAVTNNQFLK